ncbi:MAG: hypothetical protein U0269_37330 [Polyangiales bacterium]
MILAGAGISAGCMEARPAINRVQPDFLDKTQLIPVQYDLLTRAGRTPTQLTREDLRREPVWAHQITIIDKPATTGQQGISWYTQVEKINWEVTENFLIARLAYDRLNRAENVSGSANPRTGDNDVGISQNPRAGEILAVYRIQSHFDIRRSYNPQTGEELNVVEENGSDRPWYQRKYVRVDWSQNLVGGYSAMSYAEWTGKVRAEPMPLYINDPSDPNAPVFNYEERNGQANTLTYFDVTNRMTLHPEEVNLAQYGYPNIPACVLSQTGIESCQPADVHFRVSFMRLDPNRDYEAQAIDGLRMDRFGFFEAGRIGYNRDRQDILNTERRHFSHRHNLWMNHHQPRAASGTGLAAGELNGGTLACHFATDCQAVSRTAECVGGSASTEGRCVDRFALCRQDSDCADQSRGARCDTGAAYFRGDGNGVCLLPYRDRDVRPIPYHLSQGYPERMMPVTQTIVRDWNRAFADAVGQARRRECILDPAVADKASCDQYLAFNVEDREGDQVVTAQGAALPAGGRRTTQDGQWVYVGCHNPVWGTDPNLPGFKPQNLVDDAHNNGWDLPACGPQGTSARLGDLRYSMIASINEYDRQGAWGLANVTGDPETGEVFSARGAVWQTITDLQVNNTIDMLRVLNGEVTADQIANGESIREVYPGLGENAGREARGGQNPVPGSGIPAMRSHVRAPASMTEVQNLVAASQMDHLDTGSQHTDHASGGELGVLAGAGTLNVNDLARDPSTGRLSEAAFRYNGMQRWARTGVSPILTSGQNDLATRMARLQGTEVEDRMMNGAQLALGGQDPRLSGILPDARDNASPARRWNIRLRQVQHEIERVGATHQCNMEHDPIAAYDDTELKFYLAQFKANRVPYGLTFGESWDFTQGAGDGGVNWARAREWMTQYIHYPVLLHELGHSIGQRHNFASSADAINYNDRYWAIRSQRHGGNSTMIRPRWEYTAMGQPEYTQEEQDNGEEAMAYSSIMDYKTTEGRGLGRYDFAFVMHGYVNMVEAFKEVANRDRALNLFNTYSGAGQQPLSFGLSGNDSRNLRLTSFHYTEIPSVVGTQMRSQEIHPGVTVSGNLPNLTQANRFPVFLDETRKVPYNGFMWDPDHTNEATRGPDGNAGAFLVVPYRFETDDYAGDYWYNSRYDAGADFYEVMRYFGTRYLDYYPFASFGRERASFTIAGYVSRMTGRYLDNMYYIMRVAAIYENFYRNIFSAVTNYNEWKQQTASVAQALGTSTVFDTFTTALLMPEWNRFGAVFTLRTRPEDGQRFYDEAIFGESGAFEMPIGEGRQYQSTWDYASGRFWRERLVNAGSYYDKILGLQYMTDTFIYSVNRDLDQDLRSYQVNVYTVYPGQTLRLFGSILSEDNADIGPQARIRGRDVTMVRTQLALLNLPQGTGAGQNGRDPALTPVSPNLGFTTNLYAAVFGMAGLSASYDQRFIQSARLWADGDPFAATLPPGETVTFRDPVTGLTYRAIKQTSQTPGASNLDPGVSVREAARPMAGDGTNYPGERGIAARMILRANDLLRFANAQAPNTPARNRAFTQLQQYVDLLNVMRFLNSRFGTGGQVSGARFNNSED